MIKITTSEEISGTYRINVPDIPDSHKVGRWWLENGVYYLDQTHKYQELLFSFIEAHVLNEGEPFDFESSYVGYRIDEIKDQFNSSMSRIQDSWSDVLRYHDEFCIYTRLSELSDIDPYAPSMTLEDMITALSELKQDIAGYRLYNIDETSPSFEHVEYLLGQIRDIIIDTKTLVQND